MRPTCSPDVVSELKEAEAAPSLRSTRHEISVASCADGLSVVAKGCDATLNEHPL